MSKEAYGYRKFHVDNEQDEKSEGKQWDGLLNEKRMQL